MNDDSKDFTDRRLEELVLCLSETDMTDEQIVSVCLRALPDRALCGRLVAALCVGDMGGRIAVDGDENDVVFAHKEAVAVDPGAALFERDVV